MSHPLDKIFKAKSIAAIGATERTGTVGFALIDNLLKGGFQGNIYPVNPKHRTIMNLKAYPSVSDIPEKVDLAVIATPAKAVPQVVRECGEAGVGGLVIISAGFKEVGEEGERMFHEILATAKSYGMRVIGPNCLGFITPGMGINASFASRNALPGKIAFISQSGALCTAILDWSVSQSVGFSHFVSLGSMGDVGFHDLIDYFGSDAHTSSILIYMETMTEARRFMSAARAFARSKPIIVLKAGKSQEGAKATLSHTGSLAGNDAAFDAAFQRAGIIRVDTIAQLFNCAQALAMQPRPAGNRLCIFTNAGGPGVLATDYLMKNGGKLAQLSENTMKALNEMLPPTWSHGNPVDVLGDASAKKYGEALKICLQDENVDAVLAITTVQAVTSTTDIAREVAEIARHNNKTLLASWMGEEDVAEGREVLEEGKVPNYRYPESAVDVFLNMYHYSRNLELLHETPPAIPYRFKPEKEEAAQLISNALSQGRRLLSEQEGKRLLSFYGIPVAPNEMATSQEQAARAGEKIGFPVAMKLVSPDITHKTDAGGVLLNIKNEEEAKKGFETIVANAKKYKADARITGVLLEKMVSKKFELLIGAKKDPIFGPVIAFGSGGVAVEVFEDVNLGLPPLNMTLARRIVEKTKVYRLLQGYRGMPGVNLEELEFLLVRFSYLLMDFPEIKEVDINPFVMDKEGGVVLDARVVLEESPESKKRLPFDHLVISPYPAQFIKEVTLKNGQKVLLRPIRPEDEPMEMAMVEKVSKESLYFRFFGFVPHVDHKFLVRFTQIDYDRELAIIAEIDENGKKQMAGVVRLISDPLDDTAEFAILVADPWQGKGLGKAMATFMLDIAKTRGVKTILADVLAANRIMLHMFERLGFKIIPSDDRMAYRVRLDLEKDERVESETPLVSEEVA